MKSESKHHLSAGREFYHAGDFGEAKKYLTAVLERHDEFADVHNMMGVIYHHDEELDSARHSFERALEINPHYTEAALNLALCYNEIGRYDDAKRVYQRATPAISETSPKDSPSHAIEDGFVRGKIANMHKTLGQSYEAVGMLNAAIEEYRKALVLCPTFADIRTRLGTTLRDAGMLEDALDELQAARDSAEHYLPARVHLGVTLWTAKRYQEARHEWNTVLSRDPNNRSCKLYLAMAADSESDSSTT